MTTPQGHPVRDAARLAENAPVPRSEALALDRVRKRYGSVTAVDGVDLHVARGEVVALLGANGAGKSTLIGMLIGAVAPTSGSVTVCGMPPRAAVRAGRVAAMLQDTGMMPGLSVQEHVELAASLYPRARDVGDTIESAGLSTVRRRSATRLSGGQAQRLRFALVAVAGAEVLLLDEPTRALDVQARRDFWASLAGFVADGTTVLFATHYLEEVEDNADRMIVVAHGGLVASGHPAEVRGASGPSRVRIRTDSAPESFAALPGVVAVRPAHDRTELSTVDVDATVRALSHRPDWNALTVTAPGLEQWLTEPEGQHP
ncbi:MAG: ABC transporter ATP-binding protein [Acidobacteria bacterium]|nr:ABC transporter ATP-binding protein [Acidobacteriota bacterium]